MPSGDLIEAGRPLRVTIRREFALARAGFERLSNLNKHETLTAQKVIAAAERLRPVLNHYLGPNPTAP